MSDTFDPDEYIHLRSISDDPNAPAEARRNAYARAQGMLQDHMMSYDFEWDGAEGHVVTPA